MVATGLWGFAQAGFVGIWAPGIEPASVRPGIAAWCSIVSIMGGAGLLWRRTSHMAGSGLFGLLVLWLVWCKVPPLVHAPADPAAWESLGETVVLLAAAWVLVTGADWDFPLLHQPGRIAADGPRLIYGLALIAFGVSHFGYARLTASLVPPWLPWHLAWVYFTGSAYVAAGLALVIDRLARPAAILAAAQMALFGLLVWVPKIAAGAHDGNTLNETAISFALAAGGWVIATAVSRRTMRESEKGRDFRPGPSLSC
jgi:uncharacterized membrane protein